MDRIDSMCSGRYRTLYICNKGSTTTATAMVAALLLTTPNRGVHVRELADKMDWLKQQVTRLRVWRHDQQVLSRGGRVARIFDTERHVYQQLRGL